MFRVDNPFRQHRFKLLVAALALLSLTNLLIGAWLMADILREQGIVAAISDHLPSGDRDEAQRLARELQLNYRLVILVVLNVLSGTLATSALVRDYVTSQRSLREARVAANDILFSLRHGVITTDTVPVKWPV